MRPKVLITSCGVTCGAVLLLLALGGAISPAVALGLEAVAPEEGPDIPAAKTDSRLTTAEALIGKGRFDEALKLLRPLADAGDPAAQTWMGGLYFEGWGVPVDKAEAARWLHRAAKAGSATAQNNLATLYELGDGVRQDIQEAIRLFRLSADSGNAVALENLGRIYERGVGVEPDPALAALWYTRAADTGHVGAQQRLGFLLATGQGVRRDMSEAARRWEQAARAGYSPAQFNLGRVYYLGEGRPRDLALAKSWLQKAADQGNANAQGLLRSIDSESSGAKAAQSAATPTDAAVPSRHAATGPPSQADKAMVYLIRKKRTLGSATLDSVSLDGLDWGKLRSGTYLSAQLDAGPHLVKIVGPTKAVSVSKWIDLKQGSVLYLLRSHTLTGARIEPIGQEAALAYLAKYRPAGQVPE